MPKLIASWRAAFGHGDFPFLIVQLPNTGDVSNNPAEPAPWAVLRESQLRTLAIPKTGLAVTIDLGDGNLHPPDKADVGSRVALVARHVVYGEDLVSLGPIYESMKLQGNTVRVSFTPDSIAGGLVIGTSPRLSNATPIDHLQGFAICDEDKNGSGPRRK